MLVCVGVFSLTSSLFAQNTGSTDAGTRLSETRSKTFNKNVNSSFDKNSYPIRPLFGDQHLHTSWSFDAAAGGTQLTPEEAFRFARGEEVTSSTGQLAQLSRPLDWLAVTDHSDAMGIITDIIAGKPELMRDPVLQEWYRMINDDLEAAREALVELVRSQPGREDLPYALTDPDYLMDIWQRYTTIAESYNDPGRFTTLIGYEWTPNVSGTDHLHRNIIYRDGKQIADQVAPMTTFDTKNPEDLWRWMEAWTKKTGGKILAIPHNGNLSHGRMFSLKTFENKELTVAWASDRAKWEPLYEVTQTKGTSEQHPALAPNDEFAQFEIWDRDYSTQTPKKLEIIKNEYAREAYKNGLILESKLGVNPFKFGLVGSTDAHTGLTGGEENNFFGAFVNTEPKAERWRDEKSGFTGTLTKGWELGASGITGVWATKNTRTSIWDAMKRKEVYGTTGPRIILRFFGGFRFSPEDAHSHNLAKVGYKKGVPMGGDLASAPQGKSPAFLTAALKDPLSGNLDRIQIVKGWADKNGKTHEKIYDVVWGGADKRSVESDGKLTPVGNTVNAKEATWSNTIGAPELITVWSDPDFDPTLRAFYYARVIEIPTPRWTTYDAVRFGVRMSDEIPVSIQERAYSSPIWYTPKS